MDLTRGWRLWLPLAGVLLIVAGVVLWKLGAPLDHRLFEALRLAPGNPIALLPAALSAIGSFAFLGPVALAMAGGLLWRGRKHEALWLFLTVGGGRLVVELLKHSLEKPRPPASDRLALVTSYSFPSSHSAGSMMTCLTLAMLFTLRGRPLLAPAIAMACAIGWSRIALGVHWPSDVIAGLGFGMLWVGLARRWLNPSRFAND